MRLKWRGIELVTKRYFSKILPMLCLILTTFLVEYFLNDYFTSKGLEVRTSHLITVLAVICFLFGWSIGRSNREQ